MPHIVIFLQEFFSALQHLKHCCQLVRLLECCQTQHSVSASNHCNSHVYASIVEVYRSSASADIRMNFDIRIRIRIRNISCGCHADIANNKRIIF